MPAKKYILTLKSDLADLEKLRSFVEEIKEELSVSKKCQFETNLALEEAFSNVLSYGFNKHTDHFIKIWLLRPLQKAIFADGGKRRGLGLGSTHVL